MKMTGCENPDEKRGGDEKRQLERQLLLSPFLTVVGGMSQFA